MAWLSTVVGDPRGSDNSVSQWKIESKGNPESTLDKVTEIISKLKESPDLY